MTGGMPLLLLSHGAPLAALETESDYARALAAFGQRVRPRAVVILSAHWQTRAPAVAVTAAERPPLIYDFSGFPRELYEMKYPAPGAPELAREIVDALCGAHVDGAPQFVAALDERRGWDHGAWVPMRLLYPEADVPLVQVSVPTANASALLAMGRVLAFLRGKEVLLVGSGGATHNLSGIGDASAEWATKFDEWFADVIVRRDFDALAAWRENAPEAKMAHPSSEHFDPLIVVAGASGEADRVVPVYDGFVYGTLSLRSFALEAVSS
jgi:4,5-DOPA dioxygenase extradiol